MTNNWDDLKTVLYVVRGKSLAAAAADLGVNYTTIARRISRIEKTMGCALFERLPEGYHATAAGRSVALHATRMEEAEHALLRDIAGKDTALVGPLTITAPQLLIAHVLSPVIDAFSRAYPEVSLRVRATNELLDLNRREADLAIRISRDPGDTLTGLRLAQQQNASFATQEWVDLIATDPNAVIDWIVYDRYATLPRSVLEQFPNARIHLRFDDMVAMQGAAQAGLGVVRMPLFLGRSTPGLVQVPNLPPQPYADIWVVGHPSVWPSAKLAAFRKILVPYFKTNRALFAD